jgi:hypothetical protein
VYDVRPEKARGWELATEGRIENYRKHLANDVTVTAIWDGGPGTGTVEARGRDGRTLTSSRKEFLDKEEFWTAAICVLEMAANLPSPDFDVERAFASEPSELSEEVAGHVDAGPGYSGVPEAELTFTLTSGRTVTLTMSDEQAFELSDRIHDLEYHAWAETRGEDEPGIAESTTDVEVPDVSDIQSPPDTLHDLVPILEARFGVTEDNLMIRADSSALIIVGEPAVSSLIERGEELHTVIRPRWNPTIANRPGERWVVLRRVGGR